MSTQHNPEDRSTPQGYADGLRAEEENRRFLDNARDPEGPTTLDALADNIVVDADVDPEVPIYIPLMPGMGTLGKFARRRSHGDKQ